MDATTLGHLLQEVRNGETELDAAVSALRDLPYADLGFARIDHHRTLRQFVPEAVYGPGKTPEQCTAIVGELLAKGGPVVLTRADEAQRDATLAAHGEASVTGTMLVWNAHAPSWGDVAIVTAGTADLAVAQECAATLSALGGRHRVIADVGVAGLHRLMDVLGDVRKADAVVVVAGMEGALASVLGGLVAAPVIAVPTSVGYGASLEGVTALLAMLSSCAPGITVVGIDNGFGAACAAARLLAPRPTVDITTEASS